MVRLTLISKRNSGRDGIRCGTGPSAKNGVLTTRNLTLQADRKAVTLITPSCDADRKYATRSD